MKAGIALNIASEPGANDVDVLLRHLQLGDLVESLGFDSLFALEHHFTDYVISPCPTTLLAYFAGRTTRISLGTAVIVLPWHNPVEVAERLLLLEAISGRRGVYGLGRGRAPAEFAGFGVSPESATDRWLEALDIIRQALSGEVVRFGGTYFDCPGLNLRPRPSASVLSRLFAPAGSVESATRAREAGLGLFMSTLTPWAELARIGNCQLERLELAEPAAPVVFTSIALARNRSQARETGLRYFEADLRQAAIHYGTPGAAVEDLAPHTLDEFLSSQIVGTPADCLEQLHELKRITGAEHFVFEVSYGGMPHGIAVESLGLLATEVLTVLKKW